MNALPRILPRFAGDNAGPAERTWSAPAIDTGQGYRVAWWMAWLFAAYSIVATLAVITLGLLVVKLSAIHEIVPMILTVGPRADQIVRVEPYEIRTKGVGLFVESLLKGYFQ